MNASQTPDAANSLAAAQPTFLLALRGVWLLTWKPQLTWRRLTMGIVGMLVLPALVYLTTSPAIWSQSHSLLGSPAQRFEELNRRLIKAGLPLRPDQSRQLRQAFTEEFARAESNRGDGQLLETSASARAEQVKACYERIHERAQNILDDRQFTKYQALESRVLAENERRSSEPVWSRPSAFYHWLIDFYFFVILPLTCVRACGALVRDELQADTLGFLTTRPLSRANLLVAKYISQTAWLQLWLAVQTLLLFAVGALREIPGTVSLLWLFLVAQFLAVLAWSALGTLLGLISNRYMAMALVYGLIVEMGIGRIPTNINTLSLMRHLKVLLAHDATLQAIYDWSGQGVPLSVGALVLGGGLFLTLAALLFTFREYHHTAEMQK
jgi:hypothetical protein